MPNYWIDLFTGTTWEEFINNGATISGFRESRWKTVQKIKPGGISARLSRLRSTSVVIRIVQRHYKSQRDTSPSVDAELVFDLRTAFKTGGSNPVKQQQQWLNAAFDVMCNKKSNLQIQVGVEFSYDKCKTISSSKSINLFVESILALKPFLDLAMGRE